MSFYYMIALQEAEPSTPQNLLFWLKPSTGVVKLRINDAWTIVVTDAAVTVVEGFYWMKQVIQEAQPAGVIGKMWIKSSTEEEYMYITAWTKFVG